MTELTHPDFEMRDLDRILDEAPREVAYDPHGNGFLIENKDIRFNYVRDSIGGPDSLDLWFMSTQPKVMLGMERVIMPTVPWIMMCQYLSIHVGDANAFVLGDTGNSKTISRFPEHGEETGPDEWFQYGTRLMRKAAKKYNLRRWYFKTVLHELVHQH